MVCDVVAVIPLKSGKVSVDFKVGANVLTDTVDCRGGAWAPKVGEKVHVSGQGRITGPCPQHSRNPEGGRARE